jgi:nitrilase
MADIDPSFVRRERHNFDPAGHYLRADILHLTVNRRRLDPATFVD